MRGALIAGVVTLAAACGGRTELDRAHASASASSATTTSGETTSNDVGCGPGQVLCHQCDGGTFCAPGCPLNFCPVDDGDAAQVDATSVSEAGAPCDDAGGAICDYIDCNGSPQSYCKAGPCVPPFYDCPPR